MKNHTLKLLSVLTSAAVSAFVMPLSVITATAANDTYQTADTISLNKAVNDSITSFSDENWYKFEVTEPGYISIDFERPNVNDASSLWSTYLYNCEEGTTTPDSYIYSKDFKGNAEKDSSCSIGLKPGVYFLQTTTFSSQRWNSADYALTVNFTPSENWEQETNNKYAEATEISVNSTEYGSIKKFNDEDWYRFEVTEPGYISIDFERPNVNDASSLWSTYLYNCEEGTTTPDSYIYSKDFKGNAEKDSSCSIGLKPGVYFLQTTTFSSQRWNSADYALTVNFTPSENWEQETNNKYAEATEISVNSTEYGSIKKFNDEDWYRFEVTEPGYISIDFERPNVNDASSLWSTYLYNCEEGTTTPDSYIYSKDFKGNAEKDSSCSIGLKPGVYFLQTTTFSSQRWNSANYALTVNFTLSENWEQETNDKYAEATEISVNSTEYGSIKKFNDEDWYRFEVTEPGYISIDFERPNVNDANSLWSTYLYNCEEGTTTPDSYIYSKDFKGNAEKDSSCSIGLKPGVYFLQTTTFSSQRWNSANYALTVNFTPSENWEQETNDKYAEATEISVNSTEYGSIKKFDDEDWYTFEVPEEDNITISFSHEVLNKTDSLWNLYLYECTEGTTTPKGSSMLSKSFKGNVAETVTDSIKLTAGKYFIKILPYSASSYSSTDYTLKINSEKAPAPADDTIYGDTNCNGTVDIADAVLIMQYLANPEKYSVSGQGLKNADCVGNDGVTAMDALAIQMVEAKTLTASDLPTTTDIILSFVQ